MIAIINKETNHVYILKNKEVGEFMLTNSINGVMYYIDDVDSLYCYMKQCDNFDNIQNKLSAFVRSSYIYFGTINTMISKD